MRPECPMVSATFGTFRGRTPSVATVKFGEDRRPQRSPPRTLLAAGNSGNHQLYTIDLFIFSHADPPPPCLFAALRP